MNSSDFLTLNQSESGLKKSTLLYYLGGFIWFWSIVTDTDWVKELTETGLLYL